MGLGFLCNRGVPKKRRLADSQYRTGFGASKNGASSFHLSILIFGIVIFFGAFLLFGLFGYTYMHTYICIHDTCVCTTESQDFVLRKRWEARGVALCIVFLASFDGFKERWRAYYIPTCVSFVRSLDFV